jgi:hypothetical protein
MRRQWCVEVKYIPTGDGRRRLWTRSVPMTYSDAKTEADRYEILGYQVRLVEFSKEDAPAH